MEQITVRVKCIASGRHPFAGVTGALEIREADVAGQSMQLCRFRPDGADMSMKFGGRVLDLVTCDRVTTLKFKSQNTLWHFEAIIAVPAGDEAYEISQGDIVLRSFRSIPASHEMFRRYTLSAPLASLAPGETCFARYGALFLTVKRVK